MIKTSEEKPCGATTACAQRDPLEQRPFQPLPITKHSILGVAISAVDYEGAVQQIMSAAVGRHSMSVTALAVHGVMTGVFDREHNYRLNRLDLVCPDGQPVRWALNLLHDAKLADRVYGPELTLRLCAACQDESVPIYLFGGTTEMLEQLADNLQRRFPALVIAGKRASLFRRLESAERDALAEEINASGAGICFVGLGCPRQEVFAYEMRDRLSMPILAVGAAFAFHAGMLPQAPAWMQSRGLEWLYRLLREPKRLWRRYLYLNPAFVSLLAAQLVGLYRARTDRGQLPDRDVMFG